LSTAGEPEAAHSAPIPQNWPAVRRSCIGSTLRVRPRHATTPATPSGARTSPDHPIHGPRATAHRPSTAAPAASCDASAASMSAERLGSVCAVVRLISRVVGATSLV